MSPKCPAASDSFAPRPHMNQLQYLRNLAWIHTKLSIPAAVTVVYRMLSVIFFHFSRVRGPPSLTGK